MRRLAVAGAIAGGLSLLLVSSALAAFSLFGSASIVSPGSMGSPNAVRLESTCPGGSPDCINNNTYTFGGVNFTVPAGTTFADIGTLSTDVMAGPGDACVGGAPRFQIRTAETGPADTDPTGDNIFVTFNCTNVWSNTGNALMTGTLDTGQLGGSYGQSYAAALAQFGSVQVLGVSIVSDGGWASPDTTQTVFIDNTNIDGTIYTYDDKDACKDGNWQNLTRTDGSHFRNQGDCVSYTNTGR